MTAQPTVKEITRQKIKELKTRRKQMKEAGGAFIHTTEIAICDAVTKDEYLAYLRVKLISSFDLTIGKYLASYCMKYTDELSIKDAAVKLVDEFITEYERTNHTPDYSQAIYVTMPQLSKMALVRSMGDIGIHCATKDYLSENVGLLKEILEDKMHDFVLITSTAANLKYVEAFAALHDDIHRTIDVILKIEKVFVRNINNDNTMEFTSSPTANSILKTLWKFSEVERFIFNDGHRVIEFLDQYITEFSMRPELGSIHSLWNELETL